MRRRCGARSLMRNVRRLSLMLALTTVSLLFWGGIAFLGLNGVVEARVQGNSTYPSVLQLIGYVIIPMAVTLSSLYLFYIKSRRPQTSYAVPVQAARAVLSFVYLSLLFGGM